MVSPVAPCLQAGGHANAGLIRLVHPHAPGLRFPHVEDDLRPWGRAVRVRHELLTGASG